ncbi:hypothetical protein Tco_0811463 [Tanacetum coccineum]
MPDDPYAYIPGPEVPPSPNYIPGPEDPEEDDEDPEEDPADYPADRDDDEEEEEEEPSGDDADDEEDGEDKEEDHLALADSIPPPPVHRMTARISIRAEPSISLPPREEVERLLALTTPPPSPLTTLSLPLPQIPSPPLLPIPAPISSPPVHLLPSTRAMIDQGVTAALAARDATRNGNDIHTSGTGSAQGLNDMLDSFDVWNSQVRIHFLVNMIAYAMTWTYLRKKMADKYCSRNEMKKLEVELWNLKVKGTDVTGYN